MHELDLAPPELVVLGEPASAVEMSDWTLLYVIDCHRILAGRRMDYFHQRLLDELPSAVTRSGRWVAGSLEPQLDEIPTWSWGEEVNDLSLDDRERLEKSLNQAVQQALGLADGFDFN